jgi:hypothetical protein
MSRDEFFCRSVDATGYGLRLDVANVHINAMNQDRTPTFPMSLSCCLPVSQGPGNS